jgi:hypothetical protein
MFVIYSTGSVHNELPVLFWILKPNLLINDLRFLLVTLHDKMDSGELATVFFKPFLCQRTHTTRPILFKYKSKVRPKTGHEDPEGEQRYSSTLSLTTALEEVSVQCHVPAALRAGMTRYQLYRRLGGPQSRSGRVRKTSPPPGFDPRTVQPVPTTLSRPTHFNCSFSYLLKVQVHS